MNRATLKVVVCTVAILVAAVAVGAAPPAGEQRQPTTSAATVHNTTYINANNILMFVTNHGNYGRDLAGVFGNDYGTYFPYTTPEDISSGLTGSPLYAAGIWLGGTVNSETRVTVSEYSSEYVPGPMESGTYLPDHPDFRVYKLYSDSAADNPNADYLNWPVDHGAPTDSWGNPLIVGDQTLWAVYNDADPYQHDNNNGETPPLGIEVQQTVWAFSGPGSLSNVVYVEYKLYNRGSNHITDFRIGLWNDHDLGGSGDDMVGCDTLDDVLFCYNADNNDTHYGATPPAAGIRLLYGPVVPSAGDTAYFDGNLMPGYRNLGFSSVCAYTNGTDPDYATESYYYLSGLDKAGQPLANGTRYSYPGDPVTGTGDIDSSPDDKRIMGGIGPIDFNPGDSQYVLVKMAVGQGADRLSSISNLRYILSLGNPLPTGVNDQPSGGLPTGFALHQNYPNPFNPATVIAYDLAERATVNIAVFNVLGQKIRTLYDGSKPAGSHFVTWDGTDRSGRGVASGVYFYRATIGDHTSARKMLLLK